jgi:methylthioribose-1-phosphate isomerase
MRVNTLSWVGETNGYLDAIDQRQLPGKVMLVQLRSVPELVRAIKTLAIRGAPAIGVAAAFGIVIGLQEIPDQGTTEQLLEHLEKIRREIASSRPTAVNLFHALDRVCTKVAAAEKNGTVPAELKKTALAEARAIFDEDVAMCRKIGENGERLIPDSGGILTHCNAGALATAGQGTALALLYEAQRKGKKFRVYVDETRPLLQGARLTAWECKESGLDAVLICDNMAGYLMKQGKVNAVIVGADRIAANGDTANKIGTYSLSVLAKAHKIPFYVAAPSSTFDLKIANGSQIPIEQRSIEEVTTIANTRVAPAGIRAYNPAFDVTDAGNITAIVTELGIITEPDSEKIKDHLKGF